MCQALFLAQEHSENCEKALPARASQSSGAKSLPKVTRDSSNLYSEVPGRKKGRRPAMPITEDSGEFPQPVHPILASPLPHTLLLLLCL